MEESVVELKYDARRAPLGKLRKEQIKEGYKALNSISNCISLLSQLCSKSETNEGKSERRKSGRQKANASEKQKLENDLLLACNAFYTRVPHDFGYVAFPLVFGNGCFGISRRNDVVRVCGRACAVCECVYFDLCAHACNVRNHLFTSPRMEKLIRLHMWSNGNSLGAFRFSFICTCKVLVVRTMFFPVTGGSSA